MSDAPTPDFINNLLTTATATEQLALLTHAGYNSAATLGDLLDHAAQLIRTNPGQARQLAQLCATAAPQFNAPAIPPAAAYLQAQAHALNGELAQAQQLIATARQRYLALGDQSGALRTNVGLMHILGEMGRYEEALAAGEQILTAVSPTDPHLTARTQQNQGTCLWQIGRYEDALTAYAQAETTYKTLGLTEDVAHVRNNRGLIHLKLGQGRDALAAFSDASATFAALGNQFTHARTLTNIGEAHLLLGNYQQGLAALEQAQQYFSQQDGLAEQAILLLERAKAYLLLNLHPQAQTAYEEAEQTLRQGGMAHHRAYALWGLGATLLAQQQFAKAAPLLAQANDLFAAMGNAPLQSSVLLEQAALQQAQGERGIALQQAQTALDRVANRDWPIQQLYAHLRLADLLLPELAVVEQHLLVAQQLAERLPLPHLHYRVAQRLGHLRFLQGRYDEAQVLLETAVSTIEQLRGNLAQEAMRLSFLTDKTTAYEDLIQLYLQRGDAASLQQAFTVAEQAKSRALVDLLAGLMTVQPASDDPTLRDQLQALQADLNAIYNEVLGYHDNSERRPRLLGDLNQQASQLEQEISRLRLQFPTKTAVSHDSLTNTPQFDPATLPVDITLLAYHIIGDEILAFVQQNQQLHVVRGLGTATAVRHLLHQLDTQWQRFRIGANFVRRHQSQLERSAQHVLYQLYQILIAPLTTHLPQTAATSKLLIIPHSLLHQLPFHALFDGQKYLIDQYEIAYAPSATVFHLCRQRPIQKQGQALVLGVSDPSIPHVVSEVLAVAQQLSQAQLFMDEAAQTAVLQQHAPHASLIHLACHGLFRSGNPMFSALKLHDAWFTASDVLALPLNSPLVTLSACESGRSQILGGDEILGLSRAFLGAGAAALAVSLWLVEDATTAKLMAHWYEQQQQGYAASLRAAQLAVKAQHPHPYYWAPFIFVGQF